MRRVLPAVFFATCLFIGVQAPAQEESTSAANRRQLADCMMRHMSANRTLSYNDAAKVCKNLLKARKDTAANVVAKPVS